MRFNVKNKPHIGQTRICRKFAFFPKKVMLFVKDKYGVKLRDVWVWLETFYLEEEYKIIEKYLLIGVRGFCKVNCWVEKQSYVYDV